MKTKLTFFFCCFSVQLRFITTLSQKELITERSWLTIENSDFTTELVSYTFLR